MAVPIGMGTVLAVSTSTGAVSIGGVRSIGGPEADTTPVDVTAMDSTGSFRVFMTGGPVDPGEAPLEIVYRTTSLGMKRLVEYLYNGTQKNYTITFNTTGGSDSMEFAALVTHIGQSIPYEDAVTRSVTLKITKTPGFST